MWRLRRFASRLGQVVGLVLAVAIISFTLLQLAPGDAAIVIAGDSGAGDPEIIAEIRESYGLDEPYVVQLGKYLGKVATGDLGESYRFNQSVTSLISSRIWPTVLLVGTSLFFAILVGVAVGVYTARRPDSWSSHLATILALVGFSIPVFFLGLELVILFSSVLGWLPVARMNDITFDGNFIQKWIDVAEHLILPSFTLGVLYLAQYSRLTRASMLETLQSDFVRTARSKGLTERVVVYKHALRNAVIPVVTVAGLQFGTLLSGALVVETVFDWPGLGRLAFDSVLARDTPVLLALLMLSSLLVIAANLLTDVVYRLIDPRIRVGGSAGMTDLFVTEAEATAPLGREALRMFMRNKAAVAGVIILVGIIFMTYVGPYLYDQDPSRIVARPLQGPGSDDVPALGTDYLGRDVLAGVIRGGSTTLRVALVAALLIVLIGVTIGSIAGFYGGWVDSLLMRVTEVFQVMPALLFALVIVTLFGPSPTKVSVAIGVVLWPQLARLTRAEFLRLKNLEFVKAARAIGSSDARIMFRVILPNALPPLIVATTLVMGSAILFEAALAFLGLGDPKNISWGLMIGLSRPSFLSSWWAITFPGIAIFLTVLSFSLIGDGLQDAFNPKLRGR